MLSFFYSLFLVHCSLVSIRRHGLCGKHGEHIPIFLWSDALWSGQLSQHPHKLVTAGVTWELYETVIKML